MSGKDLTGFCVNLGPTLEVFGSGSIPGLGCEILTIRQRYNVLDQKKIVFLKGTVM